VRAVEAAAGRPAGKTAFEVRAGRRETTREARERDDLEG